MATPQIATARPMTPPGRLLARLGGADLAVLALAPRQRRVFVQMGVIMLITGTVAGLSMYFAVTEVLEFSARFAWPFSLFWGFAIISLDRFLTMGMTSVQPHSHLLGAFVIRVALALVLGVIISTPITLRVFDKDIQPVLKERLLAQQLQDERDMDEVRQAVAAAQADYDALNRLRLTDPIAAAGQAEGTGQADGAAGQADGAAQDADPAAGQADGAAGGQADGAAHTTIPEVTIPEGDPLVEADPAVKAARAALAQATAQLPAARREVGEATLLFQCDCYGDGTGACTKLEQLHLREQAAPLPGPNGNCSGFRDALDAAEKQVATLEKQARAAEAELAAALDAARERAATDRQAERTRIEQGPLADAQARLDRAIQQRDWTEAKIRAATTGDTGFGQRISALLRGSDRADSDGLGWLHFIVALLFVLIELLPVLVKLLTSWGQPSTYDVVMASLESDDNDRWTKRTEARRRHRAERLGLT